MARSFRHLTYEDRKKIEFMYKNKSRVQDISSVLNVSRATIYRELDRGRDDRGNYNATLAQMKT